MTNAGDYASRWRRWSTVLTVVSALCAAACALDEGPEADAVEQTTPDVLAVFGGSPAPAVGVVAVTMGDGYECSGVMIGESTLLTAAHCLRTSGVGAGQTRDVQAGVVFTKADGRRVCLTDYDAVRTYSQGNPQCARKVTYRATVHQWAAVNNASGDLAVLTRDTPFVNVTYNELAYIEMSKPSGDRLEFHGYGFFDHDSPAGGSARSGSAPVRNVEGAVVKFAGQSMRACRGDSGGPMTEYFADTSPKLLVAAVISWTQADFNRCPPKDANAFATRVGPNLAFIEKAIGFTCERVTVRFGSGTKDAARCFRVPNSPAPKR